MSRTVKNSSCNNPLLLVYLWDKTFILTLDTIMKKISKYIRQILFLVLSLIINALIQAQSPNDWIDQYHVIWTSQSKNSSESMPVGGGDIGCNVWVENGDILFYMSRSGAFDENNGFLKSGRMRISLSPNPFVAGVAFTQTLKLKEGYIEIAGETDGHPVKVDIWVDVYHPVIHIDVESKNPVSVEAAYESWRIADHEMIGREADNNRSFLGSSVNALVRKDLTAFRDHDILSFHRNDRNAPNAFDLCVEQQGLTGVKDQMWNPLENLIFGCLVRGKNMEPAGTGEGRYASTDFKSWKLKSKMPSTDHSVSIYLYIDYTETINEWLDALYQVVNDYEKIHFEARQKTQRWWSDFWERSHIVIKQSPATDDSTAWSVGRNYQLFRYQLGCNAYGQYPTKFNGGLFTYDPEYVDENRKYNPDHRRWGGGSFTAQNQRLVYWPMLKSGDSDMMAPQFEFYLRPLKNAELRTKVYWGHNGASFTEQIESFALPVGFEYGWNRPAGYDPGVQHNSWVEYQWDTALEFCWMILEYEKFTGNDISKYIPLIESCLVFFDEHYQYLSLKRTTKALDENGYLVLYPGTACETYKMATNAVTTVTALNTIITGLLKISEDYHSAEKQNYYSEFLKRIPPISFREKDGHRTIAPAERYERINNIELPQLYPVYPYGVYGIGLPDIEVAISTWKYGYERPEQKDFISWHQDAIFCARLGLIDEARDITVKKLSDADRRFPTFWGPGHDWVPDHNWGGSGMIGLQEMLMQTVDEKIYLFPAWPKEWDVDFKLHAPDNTVVEGQLIKGKLSGLHVTPESKKMDIVDLSTGDNPSY